MTDAGFVLALVRGDHAVNEIKWQGRCLAGYRLATEAEILEHLGSEPVSSDRWVQKTGAHHCRPRCAALADSSSVPTSPVITSPASTEAAICRSLT